MHSARGRLRAAFFMLMLCLASPAWAAGVISDAGIVADNIAATTTAVLLPTGLYGMDVVATFGGGSVKLQKRAGDGSTYVSVSSGTDFTAAGYNVVYLPAGYYRLTVATASAIYVQVSRIAVTRGE